MKTLKQALQVRDSVFDASRRDTVLNLVHLVEGKIKPAEFFEENFVTDGMGVLLKEALRRLAGKSSQAVFKLTQAMGGGKTHNLITLGLLAQHPQFRPQVLDGLPSAKELPPVRVVAFSGRETDVPHGIWGEIASQLGKKEFFKEYYSPLKAPGPTAWVNLLKGEPTLILLDELPPYLDNAKSVAVGNSDLARVSQTALTNLFNAAGEDELSRVCVVLTDLVGVYAEASAGIAQVLQTLQDEAQRHSMNLTPVQINTDELYHILRKRLFQSLPDKDDIGKVAQGYAATVRAAKQMDITTQSPEKFAQVVETSYPFHPAIRDLYARFRENPGFQQTRALIRLMRIVVSRLWTSGEAEKRHLISVHDFDLNDQETLSEFRQINPTLENAIAHDIANQESAVAEILDQNRGGTDAQDACRLLLVSSLANVPNAVLGLSIPEVIGALCAPGRDVARLKTEVLEVLSTSAWYLHSNRDGKLYFKNIQNLAAKVQALSAAILREAALSELRSNLQELFKPKVDHCYQRVLALPAPDELGARADVTTLVISEPFVGKGLKPELNQYWQQETYKNRVAFLTGNRDTFETVVEAAKRLKAVTHVMNEMKAEKVPETDPQYKEADGLRDRYLGQFLSAVKETFSVLWYPTTQSGNEALASADFLMKFDGNKYDGEQQVVQVLTDKQKFTTDVSSDTFRKKVEARLFTADPMLWTQVKERAATNCQWQWHRRDALDALKTQLLHKELWVEEGSGWIRKSPPQKVTTVQIQERARDAETGTVELKITPVYGDQVFAEVDAVPTTASKKVEGGLFKTSAMKIQFLAVDSTGQHPTGPPLSWTNRVTLRYALHTGNKGEVVVDLQAAPNPDGKTEIRYTTDGSDPLPGGGLYAMPVSVPAGTVVLLAIAQRDGIKSEKLEVKIPKGPVKRQIVPDKPLGWTRKHSYKVTLEAYHFLDLLDKFQGRVSGLKVEITGKEWAELQLYEKLTLNVTVLRNLVETLRSIVTSGQVGLEVEQVHFTEGQQLLDWANVEKLEIKDNEWHQ
jgi:hypothetical protein